MKRISTAVVNVLLWSHERGSWQYDVICALIVAFIVFTPSSFFHGEFPWQVEPDARQAEALKVRPAGAKAVPAEGVKK